MVLMNGSKRARNQDSIVNLTNVLGGPKKAGLISRIGHPSNVFFRLERNTPAPGFFPLVKYYSTVKGTVGMTYPTH